MSIRAGNIAEVSFMLRAMKAHFTILSPYSKDCSYDVAVDYNGKINRVQCKATSTPLKRKNGSIYYKIICSHGYTGKKLYTKEHCDYFALYIATLDLFYIVPQSVIKTKTIMLYPDKKDHKYSKYLENFSILK